MSLSHLVLKSLMSILPTFHWKMLSSFHRYTSQVLQSSSLKIPVLADGGFQLLGFLPHDAQLGGHLHGPYTHLKKYGKTRRFQRQWWLLIC